MRFQVRFTEEARDDLQRLYDFALQPERGGWELAERMLDAIVRAIAFLETSPFACRRAAAGNPFLRELLIGFGRDGYVALFEVDGPGTVTVLAVRHQREDDYH
jgi:plasmid stabilization system protein ParE